MNKILHILFALSVTAAPVLAWSEGGCSFSNKNNTNKEETIEQLESFDSSDN